MNVLLKTKKQRSTRYGMIIATLSILLMLQACGGNNPGQSTETGNSGNVKPVASEGADAKPTTLRMFTNNNQGWPYSKEWPIWKWIEEDTNIALNVEIPTGNYHDTLALNIASKDLQDIIYVPSELTNKYGAEGVFLDLSKHLDEMPNVKRFLEENPQIKSRVTAPEGEIFHILHDGAGITNQMILFYREDILAKHNLQPPTTWEELYEVSKELKKLYPDSFPFIYRHGLGNLTNFSPSFGTFPAYFPDPETGNVRYGPTEPQFKDLITYLNRFYKEKLSPPDFLSMDPKTWTQAMLTNQSFITVQYIGQMEIINNQLSEGHLKLLPPPAGTGGKGYIADTNYEIHGFAIFSQTKNKEAALKLLDYYYSDQGKETLSWGRENETYIMDNGEKKFKPEFKEFTDLRKNMGIMTPGTYGEFDTSALISIISEQESYAYEEAPQYAFPIQVVTPNFKEEELERFQLLQEPITKHYEENMAKFIIGERSLDQWDAYVAEVEKLGIEEVKAMHQTAWDRQAGSK